VTDSINVSLFYHPSYTNKYNDWLTPSTGRGTFSKQMNYTCGPQNVLLYFLTGPLLLHFNRYLVIYTFSNRHYNLNSKNTALRNKSPRYMHFSLTLITRPTCIKKQVTKAVLPPIPSTEGICKQLALLLLYPASYSLTTLPTFTDAFIYESKVFVL
jgi:hypothetical protein